MKNWAYYDDLERTLKRNGLIVTSCPKDHRFLSTWAMSRIIGVWLAVTLFQCIWHWAARCDVSVFLIVPVRGKSMIMVFRERLFRH